MQNSLRVIPAQGINRDWSGWSWFQTLPSQKSSSSAYFSSTWASVAPAAGRRKESKMGILETTGWKGGVEEKRKEKKRNKIQRIFRTWLAALSSAPTFSSPFPRVAAGIPFEFFYMEPTAHIHAHTLSLSLCFFVSRFCPLFPRLTGPRIDSSPSIHPPWLRDRNRRSRATIAFFPHTTVSVQVLSAGDSNKYSDSYQYSDYSKYRCG